MKVDDGNMQDYHKAMAEQKDQGPSEGGFVECLVEMWKLRSRSEILATGQFTENTHKFGDFIYQNQVCFNPSYIPGLVADQSKRLNK